MTEIDVRDEAWWMIVRCESKRMKVVSEGLGGWYPVMERMTKPRGKHQAVVSEVPVFPGWVFMPYDEELVARIADQPGVHGVVKYGRQGVMLLRAGDIERLREIELKLAEGPEEVNVIWAVGMVVSVMGPFEGMYAVIEAVAEGGQVIVFLDEKFRATVDSCLLRIRE